MKQIPKGQPDPNDTSDAGRDKPEPGGIRQKLREAEQRSRDYEQKMQALQADLEQRMDELASAEAQRDEAFSRITAIENRTRVERTLGQAGVVDLEAAALLLGQRMDLDGELDEEQLRTHVESLLLDKPFLVSAGASTLPPMSRAPRESTSPGAKLTQAARRAAGSGNRRDIAEYLRLRRLTSQ